MALGTLGTIAAVGGAASSALGAFGRKDPKFGLTSAGKKFQQAQLQGLKGYKGAMNNEFADFQGQLLNYARNGFNPNAQQMASANQFAQSAFDPQRVAMQQAFEDQLTQANRAAALSGRGTNDPVLRAKLAQEQTRQQSLLGAQEGAFATQYAMQSVRDQLDAYGQRANNAMTAQQQLFNMGGQGFQQQLGVSQGEFQEQAASTSFAQRLGGALSGGLSAMGTGLGLSNSQSLTNAFVSNMGSGGSTGYNPFSGAGGGMGYFNSTPWFSQPSQSGIKNISSAPSNQGEFYSVGSISGYTG